MNAPVQAPRALHPGLHTGHWTLNLGLTKNNITITPESPSQREDKAIFPSSKTKSTLPRHLLKFRRKYRLYILSFTVSLLGMMGPTTTYNNFI